MRMENQSVLQLQVRHLVKLNAQNQADKIQEAGGIPHLRSSASSHLL